MVGIISFQKERENERGGILDSPLSPPQVRFHPEASYTCDELQPVANIPGLAPERKFSCHFHLQQTSSFFVFSPKTQGQTKERANWRLFGGQALLYLVWIDSVCLFWSPQHLCVHCASQLWKIVSIPWHGELKRNETIPVLLRLNKRSMDPTCHWRETVSLVFDQLKERIGVPESKWDGAAAGRHCLPISRDHELVQTRFDLCYFSRLFPVGSFPGRLHQYWFMGVRRCQACD